MASSANSLKDYNTNTGVTSGTWEDIKDYTSAIITLNRNAANPFNKSVTVTLEWAHTAGRTLPNQAITTNPDIVATESFTYSFNVANSVPVTRQYDHRARWFRVRTTFARADEGAAEGNGTFDLQTLYKRAPTELKIVDDTANVVSVNSGGAGNSLYTLLTDNTGAALKTTETGAVGHSLFTHLADSNGVSLATTTGGSVKVATYANNAGANNGADVFMSNFSFKVNNATLTVNTNYFAVGAQTLIFRYNAATGAIAPYFLAPGAAPAVGPDGAASQLSNLAAGNDITFTNVNLTADFVTTVAATVTFTVSLAAGARSLFVGLRDKDNVAFSTTGPTAANNALYIRPGDSAGTAQASTIGVNGAATAGVALFGALADNSGMQITTTKTAATGVGATNNSLFVHLTDSTGNSISKQNPLPVISTIDTVGAQAFDIQNGVLQYLTYPTPDVSSVPTNQQINLYNLCIFNDHATTVWVKIYDISRGAINNLAGLGNESATAGDIKRWTTANPPTGGEITAARAGYESTTMRNALKYNLTVQPGKSRDMVFPGGATFTGGMLVRVTTAYVANSMDGPGDDAVFINGSYLKETAQTQA
jgi:hypothetical protein